MSAQAGGATGGGAAGGDFSVGGGTNSGGGTALAGGMAGGIASAGGAAGGVAGGTASAGGAAGGMAPQGRLLAWVGSGNGTISTFAVDVTTGNMTLLGTANGGNNPSFLAIDTTRRRLYAVNEGGNGQVAAFSIRPDAGLASLNRVSSEGNGPAHVSVEPQGRWVFVANYNSGDVAVLPVTNLGLGTATDTDSSGGQAHQIFTDPQSRYVYVPCKAADHVAQYRLNVDAGTLTPLSPPTVSTANGAGPRHLALHPSGNWAFLINELNDTLSSMRVDAMGRLTAVDTKSTLPNGANGNNNTCAEVAVHPNGRFVYGSNRGDDSIVSFSVDATTGQLTLIGHVKTGGQTPRHFDIDPSGRLLLVANQSSGTIHAMRIDPMTGMLTTLGQKATANSPAFVGMAILP
jgi:6-phosphogluconolactonase